MARDTLLRMQRGPTARNPGSGPRARWIAIPSLLSLLGVLGPLGHSASGSSTQVANGVIAFTHVVAGQPQIFTVQPDGTGARQLTFDGSNTFPGFSRDGTQIAFSSTRTGTSEIWVMDGSGGNPTQITFLTPGGNFIPEWSPDGTKIAFASLRSQVGHPEVWVMNSDGGDATRLTFTPPNPLAPTWSVHPSWSPDGLQLVYASTESGSTQIWMMDADGANPVQITHGNGAGFPDSNASEWSRDGSRIAFWSGFETQFGEIWTMDPDGANRQQLTDTLDPANSDDPVWSPDGSRILFDTNRAGPVELWVMDANGANPTPLVPTSGGPASWQPIFIAPEPMPFTPGWGARGGVVLLIAAGWMMRRGGLGSPGHRSPLPVPTRRPSPISSAITRG